MLIVWPGKRTKKGKTQFCLTFSLPVILILHLRHPCLSLKKCTIHGDYGDKWNDCMWKHQFINGCLFPFLKFIQKFDRFCSIPDIFNLVCSLSKANGRTPQVYVLHPHWFWVQYVVNSSTTQTINVAHCCIIIEKALRWQDNHWMVIGLDLISSYWFLFQILRWNKERNMATKHLFWMKLLYGQLMVRKIWYWRMNSWCHIFLI